MTRTAGATLARAITIAVLCGSPSPAQQQTPPQIRARADAVAVDVAVFNAGTPVSGLTADDFVLSDNGVNQSITAVLPQIRPLDVSLVVDISSSVTDALDRFRDQITAIAARLGKDDRLRLLTFGTDIALVMRLQSAGAPIAIETTADRGSTVLNDAVFYALAQPTPPDRRQLVVVFTDGGENASWVDSERLPALAARADVQLSVALTGRAQRTEALKFLLGPNAPSSGTSVIIQPPAGVEALTAAAHATGGEVYDADASADVVAAFSRVLDDFRRSYLVLYEPSGVKREGWHDIAIRVTRSKNYVVRARKGYGGS